jgi:hypothetical protein
MNCRSCAAQLPTGVPHCPQCGAVTPYAVSDSGISPDDETAHSFPQDTSAHQSLAGDAQTPYHVSEQYVYNPYQASQQVPPPPPFQRQPKRLSTVLVGSILLVLILIGSGVAYYATNTRSDQPHAQATATALLQQKTATAFANTPLGMYDSITRGSPVLDDSLSQNATNNWDESHTATYSCSFGEGSYHASLQSAGQLVACDNYATNYTNFAFQVQMIILKGDSGGILFRFNTDKFTGYSFSIASGGTYALFLMEGNTSKELSSGSSSAIKTGFYQSNLIAVVANGSHLYLYVNKQFVTGVNESTFHAGQIGVGAIENSVPTEVAFQHAKVWKI